MQGMPPMTILDELFEQMLATAGRLSALSWDEFHEFIEEVRQSDLSEPQRFRVFEELEKSWDDITADARGLL